MKASKAVKAKPETVEPDGLEWLIRKGRLTTQRQAAAVFYRKAFRDAGGVSITSCLGGLNRVDCGTGDAYMKAADHADGQRLLMTLRQSVLKGQDDLLTVADGVAGAGRTLRALAGGDGHQAKAMEVVFRVALDLIDTHLTKVHEQEHVSRSGRITSPR